MARQILIPPTDAEAGQVSRTPSSRYLGKTPGPGSAPLVELDADRLTEVISWIYDAVFDLRKRCSAADTRLGVVEQAPRPAAGSADLSQMALGDDEDGSPQSGSHQASRGPDAGVGSPQASRGSDVSVQRRLQRSLAQLEQRRVSDEKVRELQLRSLREALELQPKARDLEEVKVQFADKLQWVENKITENVAILGRTLLNETAGGRQRMLSQMEVLTKDLHKNMDQCNQQLRDQFEKSDRDMEALELRVSNAEAAKEQSLHALDQMKASDLKAEGSLAKTHQTFETHDERLGKCEQLEPRINRLDDLLQQLEKRMDGVAKAQSGSLSQSGPLLLPSALERDPERPRGSAMLAMPKSKGGAAIGGAWAAEVDEVLDGVRERLTQLESGPAQQELQKQVFELHRAHGELHHKSLQIDLQLKQTSGVSQQDLDAVREAMRSAMEALKTSLGLKVSALEEREGSAQARQEHLERSAQRSTQDVDRRFKQMGAELEKVVGYLGCPADVEGDESPSRVSQQADPLAWLQKRVNQLKHKKTLEERLQELTESMHPERWRQLDSLEAEFRSLDLSDLKAVRPEVEDVRHEHQVFADDITRDMQELKCLVGCVEACIPRETRKAVELFKRAAGADADVPLTPRGFEVESKILAMREEMQERVKSAEGRVDDQIKHVSEMMRGLQRRQEIFDSKLADVPSRPASTQSHEAASQRRPSASSQRRPSQDASTQARPAQDASSQLRRSPPSGWSQVP